MTPKAAQALSRWQYLLEHGQDRSCVVMTDAESCAEQKRHANFFGGLAPADEYRKHTQVRNAINIKQDDEVS